MSRDGVRGNVHSVRSIFSVNALILAALSVLAIPPARADTIVFRTGEQLRGTVVAEQPASVTFDSQALGQIEIARARIERLERDPLAPAGENVSTHARKPATNTVAETRDFLRFYVDRGVRYEFVQPVHLANPLAENGAGDFSENISVRGRLGFRGSFDAATYANRNGQQDVDASAEIRSLRFYTLGEFGLLRTNQFKLDLGLAGGEFYLHDAYLKWPHLDYFGNLTLGYFTVPQTLDNLVPFGANAFMEAASPGLAFGPGHRLGIQFDHTYLDERMTASLGLFAVGQEASINFGDASDTLARPTLRVTGLPLDQPGQHRRLHLGASASLVFSDSSDIQYQARPESHLAPVLVDTGLLDAKFAYIGGLEAIYQSGPLQFQSEFLGSSVDGDANYIFWGGYVSAGWLLTGESRTYDRATGVPGRVQPAVPFSLPQHHWGALELTCRYSYLDLADGAVDGGRMNIFMPGVNWYWTEHIRWQFNYGFARVVDGASPGNLNIFQMRLQLGF